MAKPTALTAEVSKEICDNLALAMTRSDAAQLAGIPHRTFADWMARGEAGEEPYAGLRQAVTVAELQAQRRLLGVIALSAQSDPRHAEWLLDRRFPRAWGAKQTGQLPRRMTPRRVQKRKVAS